jgi:hypothetical protein
LTPLRIELQRGFGAKVYPVLALVAILTLWTDAEYWVGDWQATCLQAQFTNIVLAPLGGGAAAFAAGRDRRSRMAGLTRATSRGPFGSAFVQWLGFLLWVLLAYLTVVVTAAIVTAIQSNSLAPWMSYIFVGACATILAVTVGFTIGWLIPVAVVPPVVALLIYAATIISGHLEAPGNYFFLFYGSSLVGPDQVLRRSLLIAQFGFGLSLSALCILLIHLTSRRSRRADLTIAAGVSAALLIVTSAAMPLQESTYVSRGSSNPRWTCEGHRPVICVWPEHKKWLPAAVAVASRLSASLSGAYEFPPVVYERGLMPEVSDDRTATLAIDTLPVTRVSLVAGISRGIVPTPPSPCVLSDARLAERYGTTVAWLRLKAAGEIGPGVSVDPATFNTLLAMPIQQQKAWILESRAQIEDCT